MASTSSDWFPKIVQVQSQAHLVKDSGIQQSRTLREEKTPATSAPVNPRFCRLCLSKEQELKPLFPPDGLPDKVLLQRILNCLTIAISFEEDYNTFICRICIQEVTKFFFYKERCLANDSILRSGRLADKPQTPCEQVAANLFSKTEDKAWSQQDDSDEYDGEPIDSDEFDIPEDQIPDLVPMQNSLLANGAESLYGSSSGEARMDYTMGMLKPLPKQRARRGNVQDYYHGGFRYTCATTRANGRVHWRCMYKSKLKCRAAILVAPNGTVSRGPHRHNHHPESKPRFPRESSILDVHTGQYISFKMITSNRCRINPTQIICNGYKYRYARTTQKQTTYWRCMKHNGKENCKAVLSFKLDFSSCSSNGHMHNHPAQYDMSDSALEMDDDKMDSENDDEDSQQLLTPMNGDNESATRIVNQKGKWNILVHKGYQFGFPRIERKNTRWACYKKSLFNCPASLITNWAGKVMRESDWAHNHGPGDGYDTEAPIEGYMQEPNTKEQVFYKLIPGKRGQRFIVYKGYRYSSDRLISDGRIAWKCTKCKVFIVVGGRFTTLEERGGEHEHPLIEDDDPTGEAGTYLQEDDQLPEQGQNQEDDQDAEGQIEEFSVKNELITEDDSYQQYADEENQDEDESDDDDEDDEEEQMIIPDISL